MRILVATLYRNVVGGVETYLRDLLPALQAQGHQIGVLHEFPDNGSAPRIDDAMAEDAIWCAADSPGLLRQISAWRPDVVYTQGLDRPELEEALVSLFPTVFFAHYYQGTCVSGTKRWAFPQSVPCQRTFGPACALLYLPCRCGGVNPMTMLKLYGLTRRRHELLSRCRAVLVASTHMQAEYRRHGVGEDRLHLVPLFPASRTPDSDPPSQRPITGRILLAGRLTTLKGGDYLIDAVSRARRTLGRDLSLVVAGDGADRGRLESLAQRRGVPARFLGWVDANCCTREMREVDLLAVPSIWPEPFGLVGIEAACVGLPAVGYAVGGIPDWLLSGESGELAPGDPPTSHGLADAIARALRDPNHLDHLRRGAWRVAQRFTLQRHLQALEAVFQQVACRAPSLALASHSLASDLRP